MPFHEALEAAKKAQSLPDYVRVRNAQAAAAERRMRRETRAAGRQFAEHDLDGESCEVSCPAFRDGSRHIARIEFGPHRKSRARL